MGTRRTLEKRNVEQGRRGKGMEGKGKKGRIYAWNRLTRYSARIGREEGIMGAQKCLRRERKPEKGITLKQGRERKERKWNRREEIAVVRRRERR